MLLQSETYAFDRRNLCFGNAFCKPLIISWLQNSGQRCCSDLEFGMQPKPKEKQGRGDCGRKERE